MLDYITYITSDHCPFTKVSFDANDVEIPVYLKFKKTDEDGLHKLKENSLNPTLRTRFVYILRTHGSPIVNHTVCCTGDHTIVT